MPLGTRILSVMIALPEGTVTLDQSLDLRVRIRKDALAIQNTCSVEIYNLSQNLRERLLSQFTAWNKRNLEQGTGSAATQNYIGVTIQAGYSNANGQSTSTTIFAGQIALAGPTSGPPNVGVRLECYSQQLSKLEWITAPAPTSGTFKSYVQWAGAQMGVSSVVCETSYDNQPITNPFASTHVVAELLVDIQSAYRPNVAAFIDNNVLYVKDVNKVVSSAQVVNVSEFIEIPMWTEWGVEYTTLFDPKIILAGATAPQSVMNPTLNQTFVTSSLEYDLTSREVPFYVKVNGNPSA
jgi:hypothetical protein